MPGRRVKAGKAIGALAAAHRRRRYYDDLVAAAQTPWDAIRVRALHLGAAIRHAPAAAAEQAAATALEQMDRQIRELEQMT